MQVTILTATYNRAYTLERLYKSLLKQTSSKFEWLIIDDGSQDNTGELINGFIRENKIKIRYFLQNNGGKHRALNYGLSFVTNELTFFVDSDDWLSNDAVEQILFYAKKYKDCKDIACISFLKSYSNNRVNGPRYKKDEYIGDYINDRLNNNNWGDKAEVCFTNKLKEFPFLEIENENFLSEGYLWIRMAMKYNTVYVNKVIYIADYLTDGLTKNIYNIRVRNPLGCIEVAKLACNKKANVKIKCKNMIKYIAYSKIAKISIKNQFEAIDYKSLYILMFFPGLLFFLFVKYKVELK